jgi:hypothetical protein
MDREIQIFVKGVRVMGSIRHLSSRDICVEILEPYQGVSTGRHIPYFAAPHVSFTGEYGMKRAKQLLKQIYKICVEAELHAPKLAKVVEQWDLLKAKTREVSEQNRLQKIELRKQFRAGKIAQTHYQNALRSMEIELTDYHIKTSALFREKVQPFFTEIISIGTDEMVMKLIKDRVGGRINP